MCWYVPPEHWSGLILFVDQLPLGRDMCPQELVDAARDGLSEDGRIVEQQPDILIVVEEGGLDEDGGHIGTPQDAEVVALFDAAVIIAVIDGLQAGDELVLDAGRECSGFARDLVAVSLGSSSAARIDVDADEEIRRPAIGGVDDTGPAGRFAAKVMALQQLHHRIRIRSFDRHRRAPAARARAARR